MKKYSVSVFIMLFLLVTACSNEDRDGNVGQADIKQYRQDIDTKIRAFKIDLLQMKEDVSRVSSESKDMYLKTIDKIEQRVIQTEQTLETFDTLSNKRLEEAINGVSKSIENIEVGLDTMRIQIRDVLEMQK